MSTRLGDLIQVIDTLHPDADQLAQIAELLPERNTEIPATTPAARSPRRGPVEPNPSPSRMSSPSRSTQWRRRRVRVRPAVGDWSFVPRHPVARLMLAVLVILMSALVLTDRLDARPLLVVIAALIVIRPLWWYGVRSGSAWWYSTRRHSVAEYEDLHHGTETGDVAPDERALTSARWQPPPPPTPLTDPDQARAVAALLAGRPGPGDIDILATINAKAARRPLTTVPRRRRWNTSQGMHLHIDTGPALEPYRHDIDRLRNALVAIASTHAVIELGFDGDPRAITHPRRVVGRRGCLPLADRLPPPETPVLVVTDLGIAVPHTGSPPAPIAFLDHYHLLTQAGCAVHYLVPYPRDRWPPALRDLPILYWEDGLGATTVLAGLRRRARR